MRIVWDNLKFLRNYLVKKLRGISKYEILLLVLFVFWLVNEVYWLHSDTYPLIWDEAHHFTVSLQFHESIMNLDFQRLLSIDSFYPPLAPLVSIPGYVLFGRSSDIGIFFENAPFLVLLLFSTFSIGKYLKDESTGFLAAFFLITSPMVFGLSRDFLLDFPLLAMVTTAIWVMLKTDRFENSKYSILYGIVFGLGLLTKWTFVVFTIPPLIVYSFAIVKNWFSSMISSFNIFKFNINSAKQSSSKHLAALNFLLIIVCAVIIAAPFYIANFSSIMKSIAEFANFGALENDPTILSLSSFLYYLVKLINLQISFPYFIFFLIGLTFFITTVHLKRETKILIASSIVLPYIIFTLTSNKDPRYTLPMISAIALITAYGLIELVSRFKKPKFVKIITFLLVASIGLTIFFGASYRFVDLPTITLASSVGEIKLFGDYSSNNPPYAKKVMNEDLKSGEILDTINKYLQNSTTKSIRVLMNNPVVNSPLEYNIALDYLQYNLEGVGGNDISYLFNSDIIVSQEGGFIGTFWQENEIANTINFFNEYNNKTQAFELLNSIVLPSGWGTVQIFGNKARHQMILNETPNCTRTNIFFGERIELLGFNATAIDVQSKKVLAITYYWQCLQQINRDYTVYVHFTDENGSIVFSEEHKPIYNLIQTSRWRQNQVFQESYVIPIPENLQGSYFMRMGIWDPSTKEHLSILPSLYDDGSNRATIGNITINP